MVSTNSVIPKEIYSTFWSKSRIVYSYSDLPFLLMSASGQPPEKSAVTGRIITDPSIQSRSPLVEISNVRRLYCLEV
jgi:hypothetical protein